MEFFHVVTYPWKLNFVAIDYCSQVYKKQFKKKYFEIIIDSEEVAKIVHRITSILHPASSKGDTPHTAMQ